MAGVPVGLIPRRRLGLRARLTLIYALGALLLTSTVAASSFVLTQRRLLSETERNAESQFYRNVKDLRRSLQALPFIPANLPSSVEPEEEPDTTTTTRSTTTTTRPTTTTTTEPTTSTPETEVALDVEGPPADGTSVVGVTDTTAAGGPELPTTGAASVPTTAPATTRPRSPRNTLEAERTTTIPETDLDLEGIFGPSLPSSEPSGGEDEPEPTRPDDPIGSILTALVRPNNAQSLLVVPPDPQPPDPGADPGVADRVRQFSPSGLLSSDLPLGLQTIVADGVAAKFRFNDASGGPRLALGVRIPEFGTTYYENVPLIELENTLDSLRNILFGVSLAASASGAALGYYSAYRAVQPLNRVSAAAQAISEGDFDTRLDDQIDPDLGRLTASFNQMVEALQRRIERDEQFASDVSHELRSPLMTLTASVGVLEGRRNDLPPPAQQAVDLLSKDLRRFQRLVEDLLEISRMDVGAIELDLTPVFLREFLRFVIAQSSTPDINIGCSSADAFLLVRADKRRMAQVITNLLDNAAKYANGATAVSFERVGDLVHIHVDDAGPGVRPEDRNRIFDRFTRAGSDAGRRDVAKGVGLGLSLVSEHIRLHGGRVWVTDRQDGRPGARFVIEMPIDETVMADDEMAT